jgi:predicted enzyme related to lactoylglutathione lyase
MLRGLTTAAYPVADLAAATRWYTEVLGVQPYFDTPAYVEFRIGDYQHELGLLDTAHLGELGGAEASTAPGGVILYWHVDDVEAGVARLVALGATVHQPPRDFGGEGFIGASVIDPFGNILGLMQNPHYLEVLAGRTAG